MKLYLLELFVMDVERMTPADWLGVVVTVMTFVSLSIAYVKVFHPKNKESLESHRYHLIDHDRDVPYWGRERRQARVRHK